MSERAVEVSRISPSEVKDCIESGEEVFILDVRAQRDAGQIPTSFWFEPNDLLKAERILLSARKDQLIVVYDERADAAVSLPIAQKLVAQGYINAHALEGGLGAWRTEGFRIEPRPRETLIGTEGSP